jgi:hypothetical protein
MTSREQGILTDEGRGNMKLAIGILRWPFTELRNITLTNALQPVVRTY